MRHRVRFPLVLLVLAWSLFLTPAAHGWQNGNSTHRFGSQTTQQWILTQAHRLAADGGGDWLDLSVALEAVDDPDTRYRDFRYHRYQRWGGRKSGAAPARVAARYQACLDALARGDAAAASKEFGLLAHYYTDACDPLHTAQGRAEARRDLHKRYEQRVMLLLNRASGSQLNACADRARAAVDAFGRGRVHGLRRHGRSRRLRRPGARVPAARLQRPNSDADPSQPHSRGGRPRRHHGKSRQQAQDGCDAGALADRHAHGHAHGHAVPIHPTRPGIVDGDRGRYERGRR